MSRWLAVVAGTLIGAVVPVAQSGAQAKKVDLPNIMSWTAYTVGTSGYAQAVAIGNMLRTKHNVTVRVLPGEK